jgi:hypothetical protein
MFVLQFPNIRKDPRVAKLAIFKSQREINTGSVDQYSSPSFNGNPR